MQIFMIFSNGSSSLLKLIVFKKITQMSGQNKVEPLKQWLQPPQSFKSHLSWLYYTDMVNFIINKRQ